MNWLDLICIAFLFGSMAIGFMRGFVRDFFATFVWFFSGFVAVFVAPYLVPFVNEYVTDIMAARCMAIVIAYLLTLIIFLLSISLISYNPEKAILSTGNSISGLIFGLFRSICVIMSLCVLMHTFEIPSDSYESMKHSRLITTFYTIAASWMQIIY
jgi:uncharacterized membrane protein required for colicin V production